jgi:hypothetical protein
LGPLEVAQEELEVEAPGQDHQIPLQDLEQRIQAVAAEVGIMDLVMFLAQADLGL